MSDASESSRKSGPPSAAALATAGGTSAGYFLWLYGQGRYHLYQGFGKNEYFEPTSGLDYGNPSALPWLVCGAGFGLVLLGFLAWQSRLRRPQPWSEAFQLWKWAGLPALTLLLQPLLGLAGMPTTLLPVFHGVLALGASAGLIAWGLIQDDPSASGAGRGCRAVLVAAMLAHFGILAGMSVCQLHALNLGFSDSGNIAEGLSQTLRGNFIRSFNQGYQGPGPGTIMDHLYWYRIALIPIYWLFPRHETFLVLNALALSAGAIPVYLLARQVLGSPTMGLGFALAYLLYPPLLHLNFRGTYGPEDESYAVPLLLAAFCAVAASRPNGCIFWCVLAAAVKENFAPTTAMVGLWMAWKTPHRRHGLALATGSILYFFIGTKWIIPLFRPQGYFVVTYYSTLGSSYSEIAWRILTDPGLIAGKLAEYRNLSFLLHLLCPLLLLPLASPLRLAILAPSLFFLLLSENQMHHSILFWGHASLIPVLFFAAIHAVERLRPVLSSRASPGRASCVGLTVAVLTSSALSGYLFFFRMLTPATFTITPRDRLVKEIQALVPRESSVLTGFRLASHFTDYRELNSTQKYTEAGQDYVILDARDRWVSYEQTLAVRDAVLRNSKYGLVYHKEDFFVFKQGAPREDLWKEVRLDSTPEMDVVVGQIQGNSIKLLGWNRPRSEGPRSLVVESFWECIRPPDAEFEVRVEIHLPDGAAMASQHLMAGWLYPTTLWKPGDLVRDLVRIELDHELPNDATIRIGISLARISHPGGMRNPW